MLTKGNIEIGLKKRFGPDGPGVPCGARAKAGGSRQRPAVKQTDRFTRHGSKNSGVQTKAGRDKIAALCIIHGRTTKDERSKAKNRAEAGRQERAELKEIKQWTVDHGHLTREWRDQFK